MDVRLESPSDAAAIRAVLEAAFPTATEAELVDELRRAGMWSSRWRRSMA
jgi:putative acetyltransferase